MKQPGSDGQALLCQREPNAPQAALITGRLVKFKVLVFTYKALVFEGPPVSSEIRHSEQVLDPAD